MASVVASRYAHALFELAKQEDVLDTCKENLDVISQGMKEYPDLFMLLKHPKIDKKDKKDILSKSFVGAHVYVLNFAKLLIDRNRFGSIEDIQKVFKELYNKEKGIEIAYIQSASSLDKKQEAEIIQMLKEKRKKDIEAKVTVVPELIAGLRIQVGNDVLDNSALTRLAKMKHEAKNS